MVDDTPEEARLRRLLLRKGLLLLTAPAEAPRQPGGRHYVVGSVGRNGGVFYGPPGRSGATLEEVAAWLAARSA